MRNPLPKNINLFIILGVSLFVIGGTPVKFGQEEAFFHGYSIPKPIIKIGLGINLGDVKISSSSGMKVYEINHNYKFLADGISEVYIKTHQEKLSEKFIIQVAQKEKREKAEMLAQELKSKICRQVTIKEKDKENIGGKYKVIVGDFLTRGDALDYMKKLQQMDLDNMWIIREEITEEQAKPLWIIFEQEVRSLSDSSTLYFIPSNSQSYLSFNNRDYRGIFVLKTSSAGIALINILNIEDYLKGVVPSELSPYSFSQLEAQKAQAVAARTYAIKNIGLNGDLGFDLCDTPKSQYYQGMSAEHPLSSKAVESTKGEVVVYNGKLIDALYTSTCGGRTANVENVFLGPALPYLKSTECIYKNQEEWQIKSDNMVLPVFINGKNINREISMLISLGVILPQENVSFYKKKVTSQKALQWIQTASSLLGKKRKEISIENSPLTLSAFIQIAVKSFRWEERVNTLTVEGERDYMLKESEGWEGKAKNYMAYFIQEGIFPPTNEILSPDKKLLRGEVIFYLARILESYEGLFHQGKFLRMNKGCLKIEEKENMKSTEEKILPLASEAFLLKSRGGEYSFTSNLFLLGGEKVRWLEKNGEICWLEIIYPSQSNVLDRSSVYHHWQVSYPKEKLERRINQFYPVGQLMDLTVQKKGESKRVVELLIKGTESKVVVKGLRIRYVLGLKENLFVIDREYGKDGQINHFIFIGRGWGHGVGLCQVGAYGMALSGAEYKEILKKYYQGIKIKKIY